MPRYSWSLDQETYHSEFETREEAVEDAISGDPPEAGYGRSVWTGRIVPVDVKRLVSGYQTHVMEWLTEQAFDQCGLPSEDWLDPKDVPKEALSALDKAMGEMVEAWLKEHGLMPKFWAVDDVSEHLVSGGPFWKNDRNCDHPWHNGSLIMESCPRCGMVFGAPEEG